MPLPPPRFHYAWIVLAIGTFTVFGALGLGRFGYTMILPVMKDDLAMNNTQAGVLATANLAGYLALTAIGGLLASHYGPRVVVGAGLLVAGIGMLFTGLVDNFLPAALWRGVTGLGSGASNVPMLGLLAAWFSSRRRGFATGVVVTGSSIGLICLGLGVPPVLNAFGENGWRACWFFYGALTLLAAAATLFLRNRPAEMGLMPFGTISNHSVSSSSDAVRHTSLVWKHIYQSPQLWHLGVVYVAFGFSYIIYLTFFTERLTGEMGYTPESSGRLFMMMGWLSLFCGVIWGTVSDLIGRKWTLATVYVIQALSYTFFAVWNTPIGVVVSAVLFALTVWSVPTVMAAACGDFFGSRLAPATLGFITIFFAIGQALGPTVAGAIADAACSFTPAFLLAGGMAFLGALGAASLRKHENPNSD